jgi:hypothetical protein
MRYVENMVHSDRPQMTILGGTQKFPELLKKIIQSIWTSLKLQSPSKYSPCDWIQQSQHRSQCWKHCLKSLTELRQMRFLSLELH